MQLGLFQLALALLELTYLVYRSMRRPLTRFDEARLIMPSILFSSGVVLGYRTVDIAQYLVALGLGSLVLSSVFAARKSEVETGMRTIVVWFAVFLWLGLGFYALLYRLLPFYMELDVLRFQLYMAIPQSILAAAFLNRIYSRFSARREDSLHSVFHKRGIFAQLTLVALLLSSTALASAGKAIGPVKESVPIPAEVIAYYAGQTSGSRIL